MAWLGTWAKRVKLTIDSGDIDAALTDFPILVYISASSGINSEDISLVFDELQNDGNRKKIAVTKLDGTTELYVEIEKWDDANEKAWLWVKVSGVDSIASDANTDLYLYYDSSHAANDAYVGDPSDAVVHNVWDSNFKLVCHMRDDPDNENVRDSTVNANDGAKVGAAAPALTTTAQVAEAQHFDGSDDFITCGNPASLQITGAITLEAWIKSDITSAGENKKIISKDDGTNRAYTLLIRNDLGNDEAGIYKWKNGAGAGGTGNSDVVDQQWWYIAGVDTGSALLLYENGADQSNADGPYAAGIDNDPTDLEIGRKGNGGSLEWDGIIDEVRISAVARPAAWIAATYETIIDHLLDWGSEEEIPIGGIDTAEKRRSISGIMIPLMPGVTPNAGKDSEWRLQSGWSYSGIAASTPPTGFPEAFMYYQRMRRA